MQKVDYKYNIRGWLTAINDTCTTFGEGDRFGMRLWYDRKPDGSEGLYNGNIASIKWCTPNYKNLQYVYTYDGANRLKQSLFTGAGFSANSFKELYAYTKNGNIKTLVRFGVANSPAIDYITYGYQGAGSSRLNYANDVKGDAPETDDFPGIYTGTATRYGYDYNGNLVRDDYRGLTLTYNYMNLPEQLDFGSGNRINYFYNSTGEKMVKMVKEGNEIPTMTWYFGPIVHEGILNQASALRYIFTPEGRIVNDSIDGYRVWRWEYFLKDHLGNVRAVISPSDKPGYPAVLQETHYYPFGVRMPQISTKLTSSSNKYLFGGKEYQDDFGLDWYNFGARGNYDAASGRWHSVDPMAEKHFGFTPFSYCINNPLKYIDPFGLDTFNINVDNHTINRIPVKDSQTHTYIIQNSDGTQTIYNLEINENSQVLFPDEGLGFDRYGPKEQDGDHYLTPEAAAATFGLVSEVISNENSDAKISLGDMSDGNGGAPGGNHDSHGGRNGGSGVCIDYRYVDEDFISRQGTTSSSWFNAGANKLFLDYAGQWGFTKNYISSQSNIWQGLNVNGTPYKGHENHGHLTYKGLKK